MENLAEVIKWYVLAGVEDICADETFNALDTPPLPENKVVRKVPVVAAMRPAITDLAQANDSARLNARELCAKANNLSELKKAVESFDGCSLKFSANSTVFGYGNPNAAVMFIGEAPGADEDREGKPFVGKSGGLLDKMIAAIGLKREDCFISNILPWRPPGNRTPTDGEVAVCLPFLRRQIELVDPKVIILLGGSAANAVLENVDSISSLRGHFTDYTTSQGKVIPTLSTYHPAFLLRTPNQKAKSWSDFMRLQRKLTEI
ncbi:MAG: uracil-DNA glycosylase [Alphaproteobacteria bacterium]|nr:uracil-DNA glycosylase [Alphaproteobacteria bacterium]